MKASLGSPEVQSTLNTVWRHFLARNFAAAKAALQTIPTEQADCQRLQAYLATASGNPEDAMSRLEGIPVWQRTEMDCLCLDHAYKAVLDLSEPAQWSVYLDFLLTQGNVGAAHVLLNNPPAGVENTHLLAAAWLTFMRISGVAAHSIVQDANPLVRDNCAEPTLYLALGRALMDLGESASALRALEVGRRLDPANPLITFHAARAAEHLGNRETALAYYLSATEASGGHPAYALGAARLLKMAGATTDAAHCLVLATDGSFGPISQLLYALSPHSDGMPPQEAEVQEALALDVEYPLNTALYFSDFCGYPGFPSLSSLDGDICEQVGKRLVALFPPLGYSRQPDRRPRTDALLRIGILLPDIGEAQSADFIRRLQEWAKPDRATISLFSLSHEFPGVGDDWEIVPLRGLNLVPIQQALFDSALDILILPEPANSPLTYVLSLSRLASMQVVLTSSDRPLTGPTLDQAWSVGTLEESLDSALASLQRPWKGEWTRLPPSFVSAISMEQACAESKGKWEQHCPPTLFSVPGAVEIGKGGVTQLGSLALTSPAAGYGRVRDVDVHHGEPAFLSPHFAGLLHDYSFIHDSRRMASIIPLHGWLYSWRLLEEEVDGRFLVQPHRRICTMPHAVVLRGKASPNYFHWLFDTLAQLEAVVADPSLDDWPILIDHGLHPNLEASLTLVGGRQRTLLRQPFGTCIRVEDAVLPLGGNRIPFTLHPGAGPTPADFVFSPDSVDFLRRQMLPRSSGRPKRRIYVKRLGAYRKLVNEQEIEAIFVSRGFELINTAKMSLAEQIAAFSQAEVIAGATGAAFANILFAPRGCRIILFTHKGGDHYAFSNLAGVLGQRLIAVLGFPIPGSNMEDHQLDYFLPPSFARQALQQ